MRQRPVIVACRTDVCQTAFLLEECPKDMQFLTSQVITDGKQAIVFKQTTVTRALGSSLFYPSGCLNGTMTMEKMQKRQKKESLIFTSQLFLRDSPNGTTCRKLSHFSFLVLLQIRSLMAECAGSATRSPGYGPNRCVSRPTVVDKEGSGAAFTLSFYP